MPPPPELLDRQLNVALSTRVMRRLTALEKAEGASPTAFARIAIEEKLDRNTGEITHLATELRRLGGDPEAELCAAIEDLARLAAMEKAPAAAPASR